MNDLTYRLDGKMFAEMVRAGADNLRKNVVTVNELNVFPIPDGDTGENMARTIEGGVKSAEGGELDLSKLTDMMARGMLLAARGNSGVILSQFFEGVRRGAEGMKSAGICELKKIFRAGVTRAYEAVFKPTEGTILTVMREATEAAERLPDDCGMEKFFDAFSEAMYTSLENTPELLPVLKEAGVIDSGGAGFAYIIEGMSAALRGEAIGDHAVAEGASETAATGADNFDENSEMKFGYCTEVIVQLMKGKVDPEAYEVDTLIEYLESMGGDSIVAFKTGTRIKLHVHTFEPDKVFAYCLSIGELVTVKVENMSIQHTEAVVRNRFERPAKKKTRKKYASVVVADGPGLIEQFRSLGADYIIDGKQTMNPSTQDFISAFDEVNADVIFVLPNNANIILAAGQAAEMYKDSRVVVIMSKTLAEGYSAMSLLNYSSDDVDEITAEFEEAVKNVSTGLVTYSIRGCDLDGHKISKGDWLGIDGKKLVANAPDIVGAATELLANMDMTDKSVIIAVRGKENADPDTTAKIAAFVADKYPNIEFYDFDGGQDIYSYIFVVE